MPPKVGGRPVSKRLLDVIKQQHPDIAATMKAPPKYSNQEMEYQGKKFQSRKEGLRYAALELMQRQGLISDLQTQVKLLVAEETVIAGKKVRAKYYLADFAYKTPDGRMVYEDTKGVRTDLYILKRQLVKLKHGIDIIEL